MRSKIILITVFFYFVVNICRGQTDDFNSPRIDHGINDYSFSYNNPDGTARSESGVFENGIWTVRGLVSWYDNTGKFNMYRYVADDKGYKIIPGPPAPLPAYAPGIGSLTSIIMG